MRGAWTESRWTPDTVPDKGNEDSGDDGENLSGQGGGSDDEDEGDELGALDIPTTMACLRAYRQFPQNIPLKLMVELFLVLWEDED